MPMKTGRGNRERYKGAAGAALSAWLAACAPIAIPPPAPNLPPVSPVAETAPMAAALQADWAQIYRMACFSSRAYQEKNGNSGPSAQQCPPAEFAGFDISPPFAPSWTDAEGHQRPTQYLVATNPVTRQQIVAIRGTWTQTDDDAKTDLMIAKAWDPKLRVMAHSGFLKYAQTVYADLVSRRLLQPGYQVLVTGHSLGGAVALLIGLYLYIDAPDGVRIEGVYTFGQPRVFDNFGTTSWPEFSQRVLRTVDCADPVPTVPTGDDLVNSFFTGTYLGNREGAAYQHLGEQLILLDGAYWMPGSVDLFRPRKSVVNGTLDELFHHLPTDHDIAQYLARLQAVSRNGQFVPPANPGNRLNQICGMPGS